MKSNPSEKTDLEKIMSTHNNIFRYFSFKRFEEMVYSGTISARNPSCWPDQYELFWNHKLNSKEGKQQLSVFLRGKVPGKDTEWYEKTNCAVIKLLYERMSAICFTKTGDREVMWRAYSDNNCSVMIKTRVDKLLNLQEYNDDVGLLLKEVKYVEDEDFNVDYFLDKISIPCDGIIGLDNVEDLFLIKRKEFQYENEARLLVKQMDFNDIKERVLLTIPEPSSFIDGVMVHPLAENYHVEKVKIICESYRIPFLGRSQVYNLK